MSRHTASGSVQVVGEQTLIDGGEGLAQSRGDRTGTAKKGLRGQIEQLSVLVSGQRGARAQAEAQKEHIFLATPSRLARGSENRQARRLLSLRQAAGNLQDAGVGFKAGGHGRIIQW